ncbi:hypothetical protein GCM10007147_21970 [Nocardiopsis kunsanensis]|uniref:Uncharacterized protein n=1 Tax=Nocardiopsis kunsanensis TaxID=141693 RepID=A0A918XC00_9ACTN|nr:hypothetical protein [Nocardiopsis kunsanensis]GHD25091.1 hypothetical protein GCM10007147_21970 [Nocardiopsis kunsanensis]
MAESHVESPIGRREGARRFVALASPSGDDSEPRPVMVVEGGHGTGKTHFLSWAASTLYDAGVPYAYVDLAEDRFTDVTSVLSFVASVNASALGHTRDDFGRLEFPRLWLALLAIRADLDFDPLGEQSLPEGERERMKWVIGKVRTRGRGALRKLGDQLERAGRVISPEELLTGFGAVEIIRAGLGLSGLAVNTVDEVLRWFSTGSAEPVDELIALRHQVQDPDHYNAVLGRNNRELAAQSLCKALRADLRDLSRAQRRVPTPTLMLDNVDRGPGPELVSALVGSAKDGGDHLSVVVATPGGRTGVVNMLPLATEDTLWSRYRLQPFTTAEVSDLLIEASGQGWHSDDVVDHLWGFTGGHPGASAALVEAWVRCAGSGVTDALLARPPSQGMESLPSTENLMFTSVLGEPPNALNTDLLAALTTCSAARDVESGLWLYREQSGPDHEVGEPVLLEHPLWEDGRPTVLRRLLQRVLARREPDGTYPDWDTVHRSLVHHYRTVRPDPVRKAYHLLCAGEFLLVAEFLVERLIDPEVDGDAWVLTLQDVADAPPRNTFERPYFDVLLTLLSEQTRTADPSPLVRTTLKLLIARHLVSDPDMFRTAELHAAAQQTLSDLAADFVGEDSSRLLAEAARHLSLWDRFK